MCVVDSASVPTKVFVKSDLGAFCHCKRFWKFVRGAHFNALETPLFRMPYAADIDYPRTVVKRSCCTLLRNVARVCRPAQASTDQPLSYSAHQNMTRHVLFWPLAGAWRFAGTSTSTPSRRSYSTCCTTATRACSWERQQAQERLPLPRSPSCGC